MEQITDLLNQAKVSLEWFSKNTDLKPGVQLQDEHDHYIGGVNAINEALERLPLPVAAHPHTTREVIENILLQTGKHNPEECSELADAMLRDMGVAQPRNLPIEELIKLSDDQLSDEINKVRSRLGMSEQPTDIKEVTGFYTMAEYQAYTKGREDEEKVTMKFIEEWDGSTNSAAGALLASKMGIERSKNTKAQDLPETVHDQIIANQLTGMSLEQAIYEAGRKASQLVAGSHLVKADFLKALTWLAEYYNELGEKIALVNGKWVFEDEHDINDEQITEEQIWELFLLHHPDYESAPSGSYERYRDIKVDGYPELNTTVEVWIEENEMPFHAGWCDDGLGPCWHSESYEVQENKDNIRYWRPIRLDRPTQSIPSGSEYQKALAYCNDNNCSLRDLVEAHFRYNEENSLTNDASKFIREVAASLKAKEAGQISPVQVDPAAFAEWIDNEPHLFGRPDYGWYYDIPVDGGGVSHTLIGNTTDLYNHWKSLQP